MRDSIEKRFDEYMSTMDGPDGHIPDSAFIVSAVVGLIGSILIGYVSGILDTIFLIDMVVLASGCAVILVLLNRALSDRLW